MKNKWLFFIVIALIHVLIILFEYSSGLFFSILLLPFFTIALISGIYFIDLKSTGKAKFLRLFTASFLILTPFIFSSEEGVLSKKTYFFMHLNKFEKINTQTLSEFSRERIEKIDSNSFLMDDFIVHKSIGFTAIGVNGMLDNIDGFMYFENKENLPSGFCGGNLVEYRPIYENWYSFSVR